MMKPLTVIQENSISAQKQLDILSSLSIKESFENNLSKIDHYPLKPAELEILQINVGKMCNQVCDHCHVDAGPHRKEIMTRETMEQCLAILRSEKSIHTVDLTGGAPEMNPDFQWFVSQIRALGKKVIVRSNLTILVSNKTYKTYPKFFAEQGLTVIASLPCYTAENTDKQRGDGVFDKSIKALHMLNDLGYGVEGSGLVLNLVYNPVGAHLSPSQAKLEQDYKKMLAEHFNIVFNQLFTITNMPISRYLDFLVKEGKFEMYMDVLVNAFNPSVVEGLMCRNTLSISWDGWMYDCDFNQMLELKVDHPKQHIKDFNAQLLQERAIQLNQHCYGCTAGTGSSCQGALA
jgi:radical SAM/Cys-rich protein